MEIIPTREQPNSTFNDWLDLFSEQPRQVNKIACPVCDIRRSHAKALLGYIRKNLTVEQLAIIDDDNRYEIAFVLLPSFEAPSRYGKRRGYASLAHILHGPGRFQERERPTDKPTFWALQVRDRQEPSTSKQHSAIIFCDLPGAKANTVRFTLTESGRLLMNIEDINGVSPWLLDWVDRYNLFSGVDAAHLRKAKGVSKARRRPTSTVLWHRFLLAASGTRLGYKPCLKRNPKGAYQERLEVHHIDDRPLHNCNANLRALRESVHRGLTGIQKARRTKTLKSLARRSSNAASSTYEVSIHELLLMGSDPYLEACLVERTMDAIHKSLLSGRPPEKFASHHIISCARKSKLLHVEYRSALRRKNAP